VAQQARSNAPVAPPPFRYDIQGLRAVAVVLVVLFHAEVGPRAGFLGVDIFFVISGFVIGQRLFGELASTGGIRLRTFYARRVRRLLPAMALFTVVTAVGTVLLLSPFGPQQFALTTGLAATVLVANIHLYRHTGYFDGSAELNPYLHTWSLSVEEQFYLALPAFLGLVWFLTNRSARRASDGRRSVTTVATAALVAVSLVSLALSWTLTAGWATFGAEAPERLAFFAMPTRIWEFAAGVLLAIHWRRLIPLPAPARAAAGGLGLLAVIAASVLLDPLAPHPAGWAVVTVIGTVLVIATGGSSSPLDRMLTWKPLVAIGDLSYGWYLWHWPAIVFARVLWPETPFALPAAALVSIVPTVLSYRLVERRFRYGQRWVGRPTVVVAASCIVVPLVLLGGLRWSSQDHWGLAEPEGWNDRPPGLDRQCLLINRDFLNPWSEDRCSWSPTSPTGDVLVLGDENSDNVTPAVIRVADALNLRTLQRSRVGCPLLAGRAPVHYERCAEWQDAALEMIEQYRPAAVVIANQSPQYTTSPASDTALATSDGDRPRGPEQAVEDWEAALDRLLVWLGERGVPAVVVAAVPEYDHFPRTRLSPLNPNPRIPTLDRSGVERHRAAVLAAERSTVDRHDHAVLVDPVPVLCREVCAPIRDGQWLHLGPASLTNAGSHLLEEEIGRALRSVTGQE
jgi:peptidoglycan/LPS O-acetylase OafA/YrhL